MIPMPMAVTGDFTGALEEIGNNAFLSCKSLEDVILPSSLVKIGDYAFAQTSQDVSSSVTSLSTRRSVSFYTQYTGLGNVDFRFAENLESIGRGAFQRSNISQIDFRSEKLEEIPASVCEDCYNLERISIPDTVKKINQNAFRNTYKLDSVTVPLSSEWSDQLFSGVAGYAKQKVTVIANPVTKEKNIYHQQENAVDFNCVKNFRDMSITVTDELKDKNDETGDLLNNDSNEFVTVRKGRQTAPEDIRRSACTERSRVTRKCVSPVQFASREISTARTTPQRSMMHVWCCRFHSFTISMWHRIRSVC